MALGCTTGNPAVGQDARPPLADGSADGQPASQVDGAVAGDGGLPADGAAPGDGPAPDAGLQTIVFSPAEGQEEVDLQASLEVIFPRPLDEATINRTNVRLLRLEGELSDRDEPMTPGELWQTGTPEVPLGPPLVPTEMPYFVDLSGVATVLSYDRARQALLVDPQGPLLHGSTYRLTLAGLAYASGNPVPEQTTRFSTARNPLWERRDFDDTGEIWRIKRNKFDDPQHRVTEHAEYYVDYDGKGPDGQWFTPDDVPDRFWSYAYDDAGFNRIDYNLDTGKVTTYDRYTRDAQGRVALNARHWTWGADGTWFTDDDRISGVVKYTYQAGRRARDVRYKNPGPDELWLTADDVVSGYIEYDHDGEGMCSGARGYGHPGADGQWFTPDDLQSFVVSLTRDAAGRLRQHRFQRHPGPDGQWLTQDDGGGHYGRYEWDADQLVRQTHFYSGWDGVWFSDDDFLDEYYAYEYDAAGNQTRRLWCFGPGPDGIWYNDDDRVFLDYRVTFDQQNRRLEESIFHPGPDHLADTGDERLSGLKKYHRTP